MTTRPTSKLTPAQRDALEARFALRVSARLNQGANDLPHDIAERLRIARQQAVRAARPVMAPATAAAPVLTPETALAPALQPAGGASGAPQLVPMPMAHGVGREHGRKPSESPLTWGWRLATTLPVLALLAGLWGINAYFKAEKVQAATDLDMQLLTDELPPDAYADPGFAEFLRSGPDDNVVRPLDVHAEEPDGDLESAETAPAATTP